LQGLGDRPSRDGARFDVEEAALQLGYIDEAASDRVVDPTKMVQVFTGSYPILLVTARDPY
jgi:hypothetical protein